MDFTITDEKMPIIERNTRALQIVRSPQRPGWHVAIERDDIPSDEDSPLYGSDWSITYMKHSRYTLGDTPVTVDEARIIAQRVDKGEVWAMPVFAYVHSGATIQAGYNNPFSCQWDSGRSGSICIPRDKVAPGTTDAQLEATARELVDRFNDWLNGEVYTATLRRDDSEDETEYVDITTDVGLEAAQASARALLQGIEEN